LSKNEPIDGIVVITDKQSNGKGQVGNKWQSEYYKNLTFSVILKPKFLEVSKQFYLSKIVSLACVDVLNLYKKDSFCIKWPNDIYFNNKKIGGILIENIISSTNIKYSIVGIGLNINQTKFNNLDFAVSLKTILGKEIMIEDVLQKILKKIDEYYHKLRNDKLDVIDKMYLEKMLGFNEEKKFILVKKNKKFKAMVKGVNEIGQLHLELNKNDEFFNFKEVEWVL